MLIKTLLALDIILVYATFFSKTTLLSDTSKRDSFLTLIIKLTNCVSKNTVSSTPTEASESNTGVLRKSDRKS